MFPWEPPNCGPDGRGADPCVRLLPPDGKAAYVANYSQAGRVGAAPSCGPRLLWLSETPAVLNGAALVQMKTMSGLDINLHYSK